LAICLGGDGRCDEQGGSSGASERASHSFPLFNVSVDRASKKWRPIRNVMPADRTDTAAGTRQQLSENLYRSLSVLKDRLAAGIAE
jgi:hypothetical protein